MPQTRTHATTCLFFHGELCVKISLFFIPTHPFVELIYPSGHDRTMTTERHRAENNKQATLQSTVYHPLNITATSVTLVPEPNLNFLPFWIIWKQFGAATGTQRKCSGSVEKVNTFTLSSHFLRLFRPHRHHNSKWTINGFLQNSASEMWGNVSWGGASTKYFYILCCVSAESVPQGVNVWQNRKKVQLHYLSASLGCMLNQV